MIGVGEGATAVVRQRLRRFDRDETAFRRETGAPTKPGIRHRDGRRMGYTQDGPIGARVTGVEPGGAGTAALVLESGQRPRGISSATAPASAAG